MNRKKTLLICLIILVVGAGVTALVFLTEPTAKRAGATKKTAMLVDVVEVNRGAFRPKVVATGVVRPAQDIMLSPRVSGEIIRIAEEFTPGGYVEKGEVLLQIDPADYKNALELRKSDLRLAQSDLNVEMGRQDVAKKDYQFIEDTLSEANKELVLRKPQLESVKANVESAKASLEQAKLNLQRTTVRAPFDAHIISRSVNVGSQVSQGVNLGWLVGRDEYWVVVTVPVSKLNWLSFSEDDEGTGSMVRIRNRSAWPEGHYREGQLFRLIGALEDQTRMARVLVSVPDPLAHQTDSAEVPRLMLGSFVETNIEAREIKDVVRLSRDYLRQDETVWVMKDDKLRIREVQIEFEDPQYAYISDGLKDGEQVVTTNLATVVDGSRLRTEGQETASEKDTTEGAQSAAQAAGNTPQ